MRDAQTDLARVTPDTRARLVLAHPRDPDLWGAAVATALGRSPAWGRALAALLAVEGDGREVRCVVLSHLAGATHA